MSRESDGYNFKFSLLAYMTLKAFSFGYKKTRSNTQQVFERVFHIRDIRLKVRPISAIRKIKESSYCSFNIQQNVGYIQHMFPVFSNAPPKSVPSKYLDHFEDDYVQNDLISSF